MINNSKKFVKYLDNFDKNSQNDYKKQQLITHIDNIFKHNNYTFDEYDDYNRHSKSNIMLYQGFLSSNPGLFQKDQFNFDNSSGFLSSFFKTDNNEQPGLKTAEKEKVKIKKQIIDNEINSIDDLLEIIDNYKYEEDTEYNIDLKQLHKIKDELTELNNMVGLNTLKSNVLDQLLYFLQDLHISTKGSDYRHTVLYGPPGTGKTEIAKIVGKMYSKIGILKENKFVKATRQDLIAGYLGQTAIKTAKIVDEANGGVLFIDEAYALASNEKEDSFSKECIDTLCEALSNYKDTLMVIIAGYEEDLNNTFFRMNQGLKSRFVWNFTFDPYNPCELKQIFEYQVKKNTWELDEIKEIWFDKNFKSFKGNGRDMEQLLTYVKISHSRRVYGKEIELRKKITIEDMNKGFELFQKNKCKKENNTHIFGLYV